MWHIWSLLTKKTFWSSLHLDLIFMAAKLSAFCCSYWNHYFFLKPCRRKKAVNEFIFFLWRFILVKTFSVKPIDWLIRCVPQKILIFKLKNQTPRSMQSHSNWYNPLHHHYIQDYSHSLHLTNILGGFILLKSKTWKKKGSNCREGKKKKSLSPPLSLKFSLGKQTPNLCQQRQEQSPPLTNSRQCLL